MTSPQNIGVPASWGEELDAAFFARTPLQVAPRLVGLVLASSAGDVLTAGRIVEVEAYLGARDAGSHAATRGITRRNSVMYGPPGSVYVYFTYGNHHMVNLVCEREGVAGAVLIRALEPLVGLEEMERRRGRGSVVDLCNGPGKLAQALAVDLSDNGSMLGTGRLHVYAGNRPEAAQIASSGRIGLSNGHDLPYRFYEAGNPYVSRGRPGRAGTRARRSTSGRKMQ